MSDRSGIDIGAQERRWGEALQAYSGHGCLPAEHLVEFVEGALAEPVRIKVIEHVAQCAGCRATVVELRAAQNVYRAQVHREPQGFGALRWALIGACALAGLGAAVLLLPRALSKDSHPGDLAQLEPKKQSSLSQEVPATVEAFRKPGQASSPINPRETPEGSGTSKGPAKLPSAEVARHNQPNHSPLKSLVAMNGGGTSVPATRALKMSLLLGPNHVYQLDPTDSHAAEREKIEEDYADQIASDETSCQQAIDGGADPTEESQHLSDALEDLSAERDQQYAALYPIADDIRENHPELEIQGNGPYQVVQVEYHETSATPVFDAYIVLAPWPGYVASEPAFGWSYGRRYQPSEFHREHVAWQATHLVTGHAVFSGLLGHSGPVSVDRITFSPSRTYSFRSVSKMRSHNSSEVPPGVSRYARSGSAAPTVPNSGVSKYRRTLSGYGQLDARPRSGDRSFGDAASRYRRGTYRDEPSSAGHFESRVGAGGASHAPGSEYRSPRSAGTPRSSGEHGAIHHGGHH